VGAAVVIGDWDLASAAYGPDRMRTLLAELRTAARELHPDAVDVPSGVEITLDDAAAVLGDHLRSAYGWEPEQTILLVDGSETAAIRAQPARGLRFPRRSARS
jgi:glutamate synthase domain-containing protein 1